MSRGLIAFGAAHPCATCGHHRVETIGLADSPRESLCMAVAVRTDLVTGAVDAYGTPCRKARGADGRCGVEARFWEGQKPETGNQKSEGAGS